MRPEHGSSRGRKQIDATRSLCWAGQRQSKVLQATRSRSSSVGAAPRRMSAVSFMCSSASRQTKRVCKPGRISPVSARSYSASKSNGSAMKRSMRVSACWSLCIWKTTMFLSRIQDSRRCGSANCRRNGPARPASPAPAQVLAACFSSDDKLLKPQDLEQIQTWLSAECSVMAASAQPTRPASPLLPLPPL